MAKTKAKTQLIRLRCQTCKRINYYSKKNKGSAEKKIELKKYCKWCQKSTVHKEAKK